MCDDVDCGKRKFVVESIIYIYIHITVSSARATWCGHGGRWVLGREKNCALKASVRRKEECLSRPVCSTYKEVISPGVEFPSRARAHRFFFRSPVRSSRLNFLFFFWQFYKLSLLSQHPYTLGTCTALHVSSENNDFGGAFLLQIQKTHPSPPRSLYL